MDKNVIGTQNRKRKMGKNDPSDQIVSNFFWWYSKGKNDLYSHPKCGSPFPIHCTIQKMNSWVWENEEKTEKRGVECTTSSSCVRKTKTFLIKPQIINPCYPFIQQDQNEIPAIEEIEKTTKIVKENAQELQLSEREKLMDEQ